MLAFNDCSKGIDSVTKIGIAAYDIESKDVIWVSIFKHGEYSGLDVLAVR